MTTLFISDLHLSAERPDITACFLRFMAQETHAIDALYVLGDLFEMWIGDDEDSPFLQQVKQAFKTLTDAGTPCYFIHGNRDFLIGKRFSRETGIIVLPEHTVVDLYGTPTLILHGDTLCIEDQAYQRYRKKVHNPVIQWLFARLPLSYRIKVGDKFRQSSGKNNQAKSQSIMDVTEAEVIRIMRDANVTQMIHGHTHRPDIHNLNIDGLPAQRIVLGDWYDHGSVLVYDINSYQLETRNFNAPSSN
ncbi:UDP-2,3-diacylglucosamine hydrolase [Photobacterium kishitanii]|uniref:UDP-2,3-diacylglucosamine hydrolase n=1 Tax=Photobacterium kishitanii TaxID=318456 RepID=A0AAX0Z2A7_9GAMM|nr:UDP-2,3-diacylglucosamine diphosphatase [Photobacterium kishitanii]KJG11264.1 UDP-2,3-diacylglucosamine hydrolase [Photobacterium kishitanii]KJG58643.1 UDP-2,3-diacylglucosamine hydrolase [Photobacterium kishitanii]KJG62675.1 UDP-2,3-diacylglucosamine hydrolase [Photobacterium kishitanii]KJG66724.1 UDP-2,3-diacylglucosamine hydrolase [Photobacterium kishitanii]KJG70921.1 UDP-2,3-diacylglucosamine hydrolase [Photobacterium kishitanii]